MKHRSSILLTLLTVVQVVGQSITPQIQSTSGAYYAGTNVQLSWTIGESIIETVSSTNNYITQGFQQPNYVVVGIDENTETNYAVTVFPNPTRNSFQIEIQDLTTTEFNITLTELTGKQLLDTNIGKNRSYIVDLTDHAAGSYFLIITTKEGTVVNRSKIKKTN